MAFSAHELGALYADDGVHEFGFATPGHAARYTGPAAIQAAYERAWADPAVDLLEIRDLAIHKTSDPSTLVDEWVAIARRRADGREFTLAGLLILTARNGKLCKVRDYMDVFGFAQEMGRLAALAERSVAHG